MSERTAYRPCLPISTPNTRIGSLGCAVINEPTTAGIDRLGTTVDPRESPDAAVRFVEPLTARSNTMESLESGIQLLREAEVSWPQSAALANARAALLHRLSLEEQEAWRLTAALEAALKSLEADPRSKPTLFNVALLETQLGLCFTAREAWTAYLAMDSDSPWASEARGHRQGLSCLAELPEDHSVDHIHEQAIEVLLPRWATSRSLEPAVARTTNEHIAALGADLKNRSHDDFVARLALELAHHGDDQAFIAAVENVVAGRRLVTTKQVAAKKNLTEATAVLREKGSVLAIWSEIWRAVLEIYDEAFEESLSRLGHVQAENGAVLSPLLQGRIEWTRSLAAVRSGRLGLAYDSQQRALEAFERGGYRQHAGAVLMMRAETLAFLGFAQESWFPRLRAIQLLRQAVPSLSFMLHNALSDASLEAGRLGFARAAEAFLAEGLRVNAVRGKPAAEAEALIFLADALELAGRRDKAIRIYRRVLASVQISADVEFRERLVARARLGLWKAEPGLGRRPSELEELEKYFEGQLPEARLAALRIRAHLAWNLEPERAAGALQKALELVRSQLVEIGSVDLDQGFREASQDVYDDSIRFAFESDDPKTALLLLEEARKGPGGRASASGELARVLAHSRSDPQVLISYASMQDRVYWWRIVDGTLVAGQLVASELAPLLDVVGASGRRDSISFETLEDLFEELLAPALAGISPSRPLVIIPDRDLHFVPYAALRDPSSQKFLIETRTVSLLSSLRRPRHQSIPSDLNRSEWAALVMADPDFNREAFPWLPRLPGAAAEGRAISEIYGEGTAFAEGQEASLTFAQEAGRVQVLHAAAHAVHSRTDGVDMLVLASDSASTGLTSSRRLISALDGVPRLVVLSACSSLGQTSTRTTGPSGLARDYVARGVPAVVATLWPVDDKAVAGIVVSFHREVQAGASASAALRHAQLEAIRSTRASSDRRCCPWAAVQLVGDLPAVRPQRTDL